MRRLYLGLEVPAGLDAYHYPVIRIVPTAPDSLRLDLQTSHLLFTSKSGVRLFFAVVPVINHEIRIVCVGSQTAAAVRAHGYNVAAIADEETSEGVVHLLQRLLPQPTHVFWPHSALSRSVISDYLTQAGIPFTAVVLYDTQLQRPEPVPDLSDFDEIIFTSPSTVDGFLAIYKTVPKNKTLTCIGPVTQAALQKRIESEK